VKPLQGLVAGVALTLMLGCVYLMVEAGQRIYESIGPSKAVAAADGGLYVVSHGFVHVFAPDGKRRERFDLAAAGVTRTPSDLAVHHDGRIVVANPDGSNISRCTISPPRCEVLDPKLKRIRLQKALPLNSVKVAIDDARQRYYFSDNAGHRAMIARFDGSLVAQSKQLALHYPNQLALEGDELRIVDTNHRRIAFFDVSGDSLARVKGEMPLDPGEVARDGRRWPFDAVRTGSGETWALLGDNLMSNADLVVFDAAGVARRRIDLGDDSDPFDIEPWRGRILVADATRYRLDAVTPDGKVEAQTLDPEFMKEVRAASEAPEFWRGMRLLAQFAMVFVPILAIVLLWKSGVPMRIGPAAPTPVATGATRARLPAEPQWIEIDPGFFERLARKSRRGSLIMSAAAVAFLAAFYFAFRDVASGDARLERMVLTVAVVLIAHAGLVPFTSWIVRHSLAGYRLGASAAGLHYEVAKLMRHFGAAASGRAAWRDVLFDGRRLLAAGKLLNVVNQGNWMFDEAEVRRLIIANIAPDNLVTPGKLIGRQVLSSRFLMLFLVLLLLAALFPLVFR
jgi:sugar lactone lactonase YvrE